MNIFPRTRSEKIIFSTSMCFFMVMGMMTYNLYIHDSLSAHNIVFGFVPIFLAAYFIDLLLINKITIQTVNKMISLGIKDNFRKWLFPIVKVSGMVMCMSAVALLIEVGVPEHFSSVYLAALSRNYFIALGLQLFIAGPVSRKILRAWQV